MLIRRRLGWELPESAASDERLMLRRRSLLAGAAALALPAGGVLAADGPLDPGRPITPERAATTYNNFYEFGTSKNIWQAAQALPLRPWQVRIDGMVAAPKTWDVDDLLKQVQQQDRVYRHRCVEAWAMTVPWTGFTLAQLVKLAQPAASAKYVQFETAELPKVMPGLRDPEFNWPYVEGLTIAEATNDLAFVATGLYGKTLQPQNGAPLRVVLPWKYGFKSVKSLVRVSFTDKRPDTFWAAMQPDEYGFWANVNPQVPHPRWSQARERLIGTDETVPTQLYNGYGAEVAGLYAGLTNEKLFM